ncbi:MAG: hypothetical protein Q7J26_10820 [Brevundimonas sp.]|uniref:hypothetical protein n=1 Tax=Brevundimonas sp. TaxID=1871086 RepID=UPI002728EB1D|nr:hypothetical protein [Brevundimonas sp.]MDO9609007.1 hypothetical protein [Brevundimonas sp.]
MNTDRIAELYEALNRGAAGRKAGKATMTGAALVASLLPVVGGPASIAADEISKRFFEVNSEEHLAEIERVLLDIIPQIGIVEDLAARVNLLTSKMDKDADLRKLISELVGGMASAELDDFTINNVGGLQKLTDVVIDQMRLQSTAIAGARTSLDRVSVTGPVRFDTDHASQEISNSVFRGRGGGTTTFSSIRNAQLGQGTVEFDVREPGSVIGMRVTRVVGPNDPGGSTISFSNVPRPRRD